ncbi:MAG: MauE/DoxX family redox-associated membrane protein [Armatimonadota bacterium]
MTTRGAAILGHPALGGLCRLLIGGIFIYTALPKVLRPDDFARLVSGYRLLDPGLVALAGVTMPWIELIAGAFLVIGIIPRSSALVAAGLLIAFMVAGALALLRGLHISCGCFFPLFGNHTLGWDLLIRDGVLLLITLQPLAWPSSFLPCLRGTAHRPT